MSTTMLRRRVLARLGLSFLVASTASVRAADPAVTAAMQNLDDALLGVMKAG